MVMWDEIAAEVAQEFPDVTWDKMLVDAMTMRMTLKPQTLDTIVATNLHADILSDLAAALAGSLGIAPTANLNPERDTPSMFEPIHGSAFDITGKGIANPVGTFWTAVDDAGASGREGCGRPADAGGRARDRPIPSCTRPISAAKPRRSRSPTPCARRCAATTSERVPLTQDAATKVSQRGPNRAGSPYPSPVPVRRGCRGRVAGALRASILAHAASGPHRRDRRGQGFGCDGPSR